MSTIDDDTSTIDEDEDEPESATADAAADVDVAAEDAAGEGMVVDAADEAGLWDEDDDSSVRKTRGQRRREWRQSERARRYAARRSVRFPIFTRAVLLWMLLFALVGVATGATGAYFWAHFNTQVNELREQTKDFDKRSQDAQGQIEGMRNQAITDINTQIKPIAGFLAESKIIQLAQQFSPYVYFVATLDEDGRPSVGTAFAVAANDKSSLLVTSFATTKAASVTPAPAITLRKGDTDEFEATLVSWDADRDLALLETKRTGLLVLDWAPDEVQAAVLGQRVFPVSGLGGAGASLTSSVVVDQSTVGFLHTAPVGTAWQGGPIVTPDGKVVGVASTQYRPLGFDPGELHYSIQINQVCITLMECGGGARRPKTK